MRAIPRRSLDNVLATIRLSEGEACEAAYHSMSPYQHGRASALREIRALLDQLLKDEVEL